MDRLELRAAEGVAAAGADGTTAVLCTPAALFVGGDPAASPQLGEAVSRTIGEAGSDSGALYAVAMTLAWPRKRFIDQRGMLASLATPNLNPWVQR